MVPRLGQPALVGTLLTAALAVGACARSVAPAAPPEEPDARGCSDWPSRPGASLLSLDGASQFEVESHLVARGDELAIAWEAYGCDDVTRVGYVRREPGGAFGKPRYLSSPNGQMASNVTIAWGEDGSLYAAWAAWTPGPDRAQPHLGASDIRIELARWPSGAAGFEPPVELSEPIPNALYDKPWMTVSPGGAIVVSFGDLRRGGILVASSADGGATFQRTRVDSTWANLAASCPDGRPGGAFLTYFTTHAIRVAHTTDGGLTWSAPATAASSDPATNVACQDPTCVASGDEVWVAYGRTLDSYDMPVERLTRVHVARWTLGQARVASDTAALATGDSPAGGAPAPDGGAPFGYFLFPQLAQHPDGTLGLAAYRTTTGAPGSAELVYVLSTDDGLTFSAPASLAGGLTPSLDRHVPNWLGDYFGWATTADGFATAFIDNASGFSHVAFQVIVAPRRQP